MNSKYFFIAPIRTKEATALSNWCCGGERRRHLFAHVAVDNVFLDLLRKELAWWPNSMCIIGSEVMFIFVRNKILSQLVGTPVDVHADLRLDGQPDVIGIEYEVQVLVEGSNDSIDESVARGPHR